MRLEKRGPVLAQVISHEKIVRRQKKRGDPSATP